MNNTFFLLNKYQSETHIPTCIFQGLFKNTVFRSVALVTKKLWAILDFSQTRLPGGRGAKRPPSLCWVKRKSIKSSVLDFKTAELKTKTS